ncbi:MAG: hypothetical protein A2X56_03755 [Nitrospirae bacterium GWC2_57_13]|jgi:uncharacterized protein YebE (UPF0316 family)|nr:MAG: hypothetical protein A2072_06570 [Nitrospirae bacterium GWC1_57_7]OGW29363.1 MAG: hypothetical protein A2X56_03755 [Nitrospirae bacterium GWC2_57_13]OGW43387.1 MAG: hypothetical protein A2X57_04955 [Nitrospirae bacterium GWD2_57_8]HAR44817.1 hypothetical protein [Nitrospiraceae bacterium]
MDIGLDIPTLLTGLAVFAARVVDVAMGTIRMISIVHGRMKTAFVLGFLEVSLWLAIITTVLADIMQRPVLGIFYALGFSTGSVVGILLEKKIAFGHIVLRVICPRDGEITAEAVRDVGFAVTTFEGQGKSGPVTQLYIVCQRSDLKPIISLVKSIVPDAFYITEQAGSVSKVYRPTMQQATGWRAILKKK